MDKISGLGSSYSFISTGTQKQDKDKKTGKTGKGFLNRLRKSAEQTGEADKAYGLSQVSEQEFQESIDKIFDLGEKLKQKPLVSTYNEYKSAIKTFFSFVINESLDTEKSVGIINPRTFQEPKEFTNVTIINRKLEDLAVSILRSQRNQLEILEKVEEIQGLIVDLIN